MKKSILNLGKALNKVEQKSIFGGRPFNGSCPVSGACFPLDDCCTRNGRCGVRTNSGTCIPS